MKLLSLFSGIGAFEKALSRIGLEYDLVNYCEIDKYASKSYSQIHNVSEDLNLWNITTVDTSKLPKDIDLITHGSPCQSFSIAGQQEGGDKGSGTRSSLMWETVRIIGDVKPKIVIWENVKNVLSKKHKHNFDAYIESLNNLNYNSYYQVLDAKDFGIPQKRERIFIVSIRKDVDTGMFCFPTDFSLELKLKDILENEVDKKYYLNMTNKKVVLIDNPKNTDYTEPVRLGYSLYPNSNKAHQSSTFYSKNAVSPTLDTCTGGNRQIKIVETDSPLCVRKLTPKEYFRLMGFSDEDFERAKSVNSDSQLYKQAGNSIVVNVLQHIFNNLYNK